MTKEEVIKLTNGFLVEDFEIDEEVLQPGSSIRQDVGLDSLDMVDVIVSVNNVFGFKLTKQELGAVKTLDDFYNLILSHVG